MREDLLGYLLGALDADEQNKIERELQTNAELKFELEELSARLEPLAGVVEEFDPPGGLAEQTCEFVEFHARNVPACSARLSASPTELVPAGRWSGIDGLVAAGMFIAAAALFFPILAQSRFGAQRLACENNLRQVGLALASYSEFCEDRSFPYVPTFGKRAFAGVFAPTLVEYGMMDGSESLVCPSSTIATSGGPWRMPSLRMIDEADGIALLEMQQSAAGSYGYNLGVVVNGNHRPPQANDEANVALVADAPSADLTDRRSANHGPDGQNVLYEDGHIRFVSGCLSEQCIDHPFLSRRRFVEPGVDPNDSVIGRSDTRPLVLPASF